VGPCRNQRPRDRKSRWMSTRTGLIRWRAPTADSGIAVAAKRQQI